MMRGFEIFALTVLLVGCETRSAEERLELQGPAHGRAEVNYQLASPDGLIDLESSVDVARTIGQYRRLDLSEAEKIQRLAQAKFDGFVLEKVQNLKPKYEVKKRKIRAQSKRKIEATPDRVEAIAAETSEAISELDKAIRAEAIIAVKRQYGTRIAVPLKTRDKKPTVAISQITGERAGAPQGALKLDGQPGKTIEHEGERTPVIGSPVNIR